MTWLAQLAGVDIFASCGALHYAKIFASVKIKNDISLTPLNCALYAFTFALKCGNDEPGVFDVNELFVSLTSYVNFVVK